MPHHTEKTEILAFLRENISPHIPLGEIQPCVQQLGTILGDASSCLLPHVALDMVIHNHNRLPCLQIQECDKVQGLQKAEEQGNVVVKGCCGFYVSVVYF